MDKDYKIAIIVPVYNEAKAIDGLIKEVKEFILEKYSYVDLFVFEDGSTDGTKDVLKRYQEQEIPRVYINTTDLRKGYPKAVKDAIISIDPNKYTHILFMDGDGQYYLEDVEKLIKNIDSKNHDYDIIIGMRTNRVESMYRRFLTFGLRILLNLLFSPQNKDVTSALRLMKTQVAQNITSRVKYSRYNFWLEFTSRMSRCNLRVLEIPVAYKKREAGQSQVYSLGKIYKIVWREFSAIIKVWFEEHRQTVLKFSIVGASGALIILIFTWLLTEYVNLWYILSTIIAIELSILWAFTLNTTITFRYKFKTISETIKSLIKYHFTSMGGLVINVSILYLSTEIFKIYYLSSELIAIIIAFGFNYFMSTKYVWAKV